MKKQRIEICAAMVLNPAKQLLLVRKKGSLYYQLPGGKAEEGETSVKTVIREIEEETGLRVSVEELLFLGTHEAEAVNEANTVVEGHVFKIILPEIKEICPQAELEEAVWVDQLNYKEYKLAHLAEEFVVPRWLQL
ncbi:MULTISPECIES: NUDIX hydrolase [unclassified Sphingobacterium]|uniref:NUDIX hydrolase n=1 Tax=unclassified Sphingobacterium TaxID=2609468 RepID=UPI0025DC07FC|nr:MULTISPECIES: NUDIX domain-containing protein [unclassified Sphingobacterium]